MFTGLVETQGEIIRRIDQPPGCRLRIAAGITAEGVKMGDKMSYEKTVDSILSLIFKG